MNYNLIRRTNIRGNSKKQEVNNKTRANADLLQSKSPYITTVLSNQHFHICGETQTSKMFSRKHRRCFIAHLDWRTTYQQCGIIFVFILTHCAVDTRCFHLTFRGNGSFSCVVFWRLANQFLWHYRHLLNWKCSDVTYSRNYIEIETTVQLFCDCSNSSAFWSDMNGYCCITYLFSFQSAVSQILSTWGMP